MLFKVASGQHGGRHLEEEKCGRMDPGIGFVSEGWQANHLHSCFATADKLS